jgi:hypothetical protein
MTASAVDVFVLRLDGSDHNATRVVLKQKYAATAVYGRF